MIFKISKYLIEHDKEYEVVLQLGVKTTTADEEGEIIEEKEVLKVTGNPTFFHQMLPTAITVSHQIHLFELCP